MDRWGEEAELLMAKFEWTVSYFDHKSREWEEQAADSQQKDSQGQTCYATHQQAIYARLQEQCQAKWTKCRESQLMEMLDSNLL